MTRGIEVVRRGPAEAGHYVRTSLNGVASLNLAGSGPTKVRSLSDHIRSRVNSTCCISKRQVTAKPRSSVCTFGH